MHDFGHIDWNLGNKIKCTIIVLCGVILGWGVVDAYQEVVGNGIDIVAKYKEVWKTAPFIGMLLLVSLIWYLAGKFLKLFDLTIIYWIIAFEGICYLSLKYIFLQNFELGVTFLKVILFAIYRAGSVIGLWFDVFVNVQSFLADAVGWVLIAGIVLVLLSGGALYLLVTVVGLVSLSPIISSILCTILLLLGYGISGIFNNAVVFIIGAIFVSLIVFGIWGILGSGYEHNFDESYSSEGFSIEKIISNIAGWFKIKRTDFIWLFLSIGLLIIVYFLGFFENWNTIITFLFSSEYSDLTGSNSVYEDSSIAMMLIISAAVTTFISLLLDKVFKNDSIITKITKLICAFLVQVTLADLAMEWIRDFIYTPFSLETEFARAINAFLASLAEKMPQIIYIIVFLLGKIVVLLQTLLYIIGIVAMIVLLIVFGVQCATSILSCNLIFIILYINNVSVDTWHPLILSVVFLVITQFFNGYIVTNKIKDKFDLE